MTPPPALVLAYAHMHQSYVGGLFRRAAQRLVAKGVLARVTSVGPCAGAWIAGAPVEAGWEPDTEPARYAHVEGPVARTRLPSALWDVPNTVLVNVDQGDGFFIEAPERVPVAHVFTEGNEGEYARAFGSGAALRAAAGGGGAVWSLMPLKPAGRLVPGLLHLQWGYDPEHTPLVEESDLALDYRHVGFTFHGSWSNRRERFVAAIHAARPETEVALDVGGPLSRRDWGRSLRRAKLTLCDHDEGFLSGRVVDAMASGCVVLAKPSVSMDLLAPGGYVALERGADGDVDATDLARQVCALASRFDDNARVARSRIALVAREAVASLTWDNQLLRVVASVTRRG